jgi:site-specific recombinase XerD
MEKAVAAYIADLEARRFSLSRRSHSEYTLSLVAAWLNEAHAITDWREVTESHLRGFLVYAERDHRSPQGRPVSAGTRKQWLTVIRGFFAWLHRRGRIIHNPAEPVTLPKVDRRLPHVLNEEEIGRLIEMPDTSTILGLRDRALMEALYATGMRHGEACRLNVYDVDLRAKRVVIREGKGAKDRVTPLTENACHWLRRYLGESRPEIAAGKLWGKGLRRKPRATVASPALWLSVTGRRYSYQMIAQIIREYAGECGLKATPHTFRHCFATHLLRRGASIRYIQQLLGHDKLETTERYTHLTTEDLKAAITAAHEIIAAKIARD